MDAMGTQRSNTSTRIRRTAGHAIFDCQGSDLLSSAKRKELFRKKIGWVEEANGKPAHYEPLKNEVVHKDYQGRLDMDTIFLSQVIMRASCTSTSESLM
jgi:hypothetical protein